jgi:LysM domain
VRLLNPAPVEASRHGELLPGDFLYTVQTGDSLGKIAERYYGDWAAYERIFEANRQRRQQDGRLLEDARAIYPGWTLIIPGPTDAVKPDADGQLWCVTQPGDNLSGIAARLLGNAHRWPEVFELNRGVARLPDGRTLTNPELVWPGLRLRLPGLNSATAPAPVEGGRAALEVSGAQTVGANTPVRTVATYYQLLAQGDFAGAAELMRDGPLAWREASARQMSESRLTVRRATVLSMDPYEREATVVVELEAGAESGTPQRVLVTWQLARGPEGWRLVSANVGPSM